MSITLAELRAPFKRWSAEAWIAGQPVALVGLPTRTLSALRGRSSCVAQLLDLPPAGTGLPAIVDLILDGTRRTRFFTGKTAQTGFQSARQERQANLIDLLDLDRTLPAAITWSSRSFPNAVRDLLGAAGITSAEIDSVYDPGSGYTLGASYPITLSTKETLSQLVGELMAFGGAAAYVTPSGRVRVVDDPGIPAATSSIVYARGADLAAGELGLTDAGVTLEGDEGIVAVFVATGPKRPDGAIPDGTFTATGLTGKAESRQYRFLQSDSAAQSIARREVGRRARARVNLWFEAPLNPLLQPGDTVLFRDAAIGYPANTPAIVLEVATTADAGMRVQVSIGPSLVDGFGSSVRPPVVDFAMLVEQQAITLAGVPATRALVQCQDTSRDPGGLAITTRAWTASGPDVSPASASIPSPIFFFSNLTGASITLQVTSASGEQASVTKSPQALDTQVFSRIVSVATTSGWRVLSGSTWNVFTTAGACTAVPAFNDRGPLLAGFGSGAIYKSANALATSPTLLATLSGSIGALFVNEGDPLHVLAGHGSSLSRSSDGGTTWRQIGAFGATVTDCQSSPANLNEIRVTAGANAQISFDGGATWAIAVAGAGGTTARALATAPWGHAVVFSGAALADAIMFEEGHVVDWSGVPVGDRPANGLTAITASLSEQSFIVAEGSVGDLIRDGTLDALTLLASSGTSGKCYRLLWDGAQFVASLLTTHTSSGAGKLINRQTSYPIDSVSATSIGYGALADVAPSALPCFEVEAVPMSFHRRGGGANIPRDCISFAGTALAGDASATLTDSSWFDIDYEVGGQLVQVQGAVGAWAGTTIEVLAGSPYQGNVLRFRWAGSTSQAAVGGIVTVPPTCTSWLLEHVGGELPDSTVPMRVRICPKRNLPV